MPYEESDPFDSYVDKDVDDLHHMSPDKAVPIITICIIIAIASSLTLILDITPFLTISDTAIGKQGISSIVIFWLSSITALFSTLCAIDITYKNLRANKSSHEYRYYFNILIIALLLLFLLEASLTVYNYEKFDIKKTNAENTYFANSTANSGQFNDSFKGNISLDTLDVQSHAGEILHLKSILGYVRPWDPIGWRYHIVDSRNTQTSAQMPVKSYPEYPRLGNYSLSISDYTPIWRNEMTNAQINARLSRLDFTLRGQDMDSAIIIEFKEPRWSNAIDQNASHEDLLHLGVLLTALAELVSGKDISRTFDLSTANDPYPGTLILDTNTGIKGYAGILSANDVVLFISNANDETFSHMLGRLNVLPTKQAGLKRLEMISDKIR
jgi:hypothetical protein